MFDIGKLLFEGTGMWRKARFGNAFFRNTILFPLTAGILYFSPAERTSGCGQLPFTLCVVATAVYISVCASICGARNSLFSLMLRLTSGNGCLERS